MTRLVIMVLIGFFAQMLDGSLGMSYGVSTTTFLLLSGLAPAAASSVTHMAGVATTTASGLSHWKFHNLNKRLVKGIVVPGAVGAFLGAFFLTSIPGDIIKPYIATFLLLLGFYILIRFLVGDHRKIHHKNSVAHGDVTLKRRFLIPLALLAGFMDAIGGGGWGPLMTPILLTHRTMKARRVIGSVDTSEIAVVFSGATAFIIALGFHGVHWLWAGAIMIGGVFAAPLAAWIVRILPEFILGVAVGGMIILMNVHTLLHSGHFLPASWDASVYSSLVTLWFCAIAFVLWRKHEQNSLSSETEQSR
ncbi:sulfite exporter TauE/SafE family protein [Alicyclobacillus sp. SO9]|uniref:sulfite exporter TauE/SafE family protein n=1 Tax=Alicyclobacillus sp. SO9 TaxID=2665646 RepID=UPI0018E82FF8|nr:sulfite exporter TauE/SafE family protein [Alicyclobacillus sp. SO9]QQE80055.1 sulfite exporter TauE/SafE family protein [Alicyclobacillus sp. SO9]